MRTINLGAYLPNVVKDVKEFKEISNTESQEINSLWENIQNVFDDQFISTATLNGVKRWEKLLNITAKANYTLEDRRFAILARLNEQLPYTIRVFRQMLAQLCGDDGYVLTVNHGDYKIDILVELKSKNMITEVENLAKKVIPANMDISVRIRYNQHSTLRQLTHQQLSSYAHNVIRNEVII